MAVLGENFPKVLLTFLHIHQLGDVIGVSKLPPGEEQWLETVIADGQGTISRRVPHGQVCHGVGFLCSRWCT